VATGPKEATEEETRDSEEFGHFFDVVQTISQSTQDWKWFISPIYGYC